jgi:hypothetical protein
MKKILPALVLGGLLAFVFLPPLSLAQEETVPEGCTIRADFTFDNTSYSKGDTVDKTNPNWGILHA